MKRIIALALACAVLFCACEQTSESISETSGNTETVETDTETLENINKEKVLEDVGTDEIPSFDGLDDPELLQYVEDTIYSGLVDEFSNEDYVIEEVNTVYYSKEYLEEVAYNSKANIFFGYTLQELDEQYQETPYIFTLGDDGTTVVQEFEDYDDTYEQIVKNVAIGSGVILICVTVSVVTGGAGLAPVSMVFAASAETAGTMALSAGAFSGISAAVIEGVQTKDFDATVKAGALAASEGFKWGAISGAVLGGASEAVKINRTAKALKDAQKVAKGSIEISDDLAQWQQAELRALNEYGGYEQLSYLDGELVDFGTKGATRPDIIVDYVDHIEAVEVKYYNLENSASLNTLYSELEREVSARVVNLPAGSTQRIVLDVTGRGFSAETVTAVENNIWTVLEDIYPNIPIDVVGL